MSEDFSVLTNEDTLHYKIHNHMTNFKHMTPLQKNRSMIQVSHSKFKLDDYDLILHFLEIPGECLGVKVKSKNNTQNLTVLTRYLKAHI